eukprot:CAMPEP_0181282430 /NCGR_PEP_ID=MMETSP1097-20121128/14183_1 /TAXON_ID=35684 /ORGANISM="Pseudopedinella elastica, Strain CCMP716" /LENGTH=44 /DNA_ID= /DNA_START= /DNA_END= /DNA_ORIENTATION=
MASATMVAASSGVGMLMVVNVTLRSDHSEAAQRLKASSADLEAT